MRVELPLHAVAVTLTYAAGRGHMVIHWGGHSSERCERGVGV